MHGHTKNNIHIYENTFVSPKANTWTRQNPVIGLTKNNIHIYENTFVSPKANTWTRQNPVIGLTKNNIHIYENTFVSPKANTWTRQNPVIGLTKNNIHIYENTFVSPKANTWTRQNPVIGLHAYKSWSIFILLQKQLKSCFYQYTHTKWPQLNLPCNNNMWKYCTFSPHTENQPSSTLIHCHVTAESPTEMCLAQLNALNEKAEELETLVASTLCELMEGNPARHHKVTRCVLRQPFSTLPELMEGNPARRHNMTRCLCVMTAFLYTSWTDGR